MRKFHIENEYGDTFNFDYSNQVLISDLSGLGFTINSTYVKYDTNYLAVKNEVPIQEIKGKLTFLNGYNGFAKFIEFLKKGKQYLLYYTFSDHTRYCRIGIKNLSKEELKRGVIQSDFSFERLSLWKNKIVKEISVEKSSQGKIYPYTYPYKYSINFKGKVNVENRGMYPSPLCIEIYGAVNDPEIIIYRGNQIITTMRLLYKSDDCKLIIDANFENQAIKEIKNGQELNIYQLQDFSHDNFLYLQPGSYEIEFKPNVASNSFCVITYTEEYLSY